MLTFRRLLGFLRPYRRGVAWSFALAFGAMGFTVLIPFLTGLAINAIRAHHQHDADDVGASRSWSPGSAGSS